MDKFEKQIMAIKRSDLFKNNHFEGFLNPNNVNFENRILSKYVYKKRGLLENDPNYKQPIVYTIVINPKIKKIFTFQRGNKNYNESRLKEKWSFGVGGHIDLVDEQGNPIHNSLSRELKEEINLISLNKPILAGYINTEENEVDKVHFGILYIIKTDLEELQPTDAEMQQGKLITINQLEQIYEQENMEEWSKISFPFLKEYLETLK
jgi:predicted NUDIX family phosphoesterase